MTEIQNNHMAKLVGTWFIGEDWKKLYGIIGQSGDLFCIKLCFMAEKTFLTIKRNSAYWGKLKQIVR